ncbi:hypothetical protein G6F31_021204 [Rhizopus arrhizus]|nr:hypothetical protein G6F31_021204 [Rhizopus arrhizus]
MDVAQHVLGDGGQVGARLLQPKLLRAGLAARLKNAGECVLRQVGGIGRIAQALVQPVSEPSVMAGIECLDDIHGRIPNTPGPARTHLY